MSSAEKDVDRFLRDFKQKMEVFDLIILRSRKKNLQTLLDLELTNVAVRKTLKDLVVKDYYKGPTEDEFGPDLWEFGKSIKGEEVYIKIAMGSENRPVICISFHWPEHKINYPYK